MEEDIEPLDDLLLLYVFVRDCEDQRRQHGKQKTIDHISSQQSASHAREQRGHMQCSQERHACVNSASLHFSLIC